MLEYLDKELKGNKWEELMSECYRIRYQNEGYQRVPASYKGDYGIEGYTKTGITYQCYCPEKEYTDDELYGKQRDKVTEDINKLIANGKGLKAIGVNIIKEWHFVTPKQKDKRILEHCTTKRNEVLKAKTDNDLNYISDDFEIIIKIDKDFATEIGRLIHLEKNIKLDFALTHTGDDIDWDNCSSEKIENIRRKIKAVMSSPNNQIDDERYRRMINLYASFYTKGIELFNNIKQSYPEIYEGIFAMANASRTDVEIKCTMNSDSSINHKMFSDIMEEFEKKLKEIFGDIVTIASVAELKNDLIASWLADCPMDFR